MNIIVKRRFRNNRKMLPPLVVKHQVVAQIRDISQVHPGVALLGVVIILQHKVVAADFQQACC